jgi:hypothetical protein
MEHFDPTEDSVVCCHLRNWVRETAIRKVPCARVKIDTRILCVQVIFLFV